MPNPQEKLGTTEERPEVWSIDEAVEKLRNAQKGFVVTLYLYRLYGYSQKVKESIESRSVLKVKVESYPSSVHKPGTIVHKITLE